MTMWRMLRLWLFLLVILVGLCVAQKRCGRTKLACKQAGGKCQAKKSDCDGELLEGKKYCSKNKKCGCCVQQLTACGKTHSACEEAGGKCQDKSVNCDGVIIGGKQSCCNTEFACCVPAPGYGTCSVIEGSGNGTQQTRGSDYWEYHTMREGECVARGSVGNKCDYYSLPNIPHQPTTYKWCYTNANKEGWYYCTSRALFSDSKLKVWLDKQCGLIQKNNGDNFKRCTCKCDQAVGCNAINYDKDNFECDLRQCPGNPVPAPQSVLYGYKGFALLEGSSCPNYWFVHNHVCETCGSPKDALKFVIDQKISVWEDGKRKLFTHVFSEIDGILLYNEVIYNSMKACQVSSKVKKGVTTWTGAPTWECSSVWPQGIWGYCKYIGMCKLATSARVNGHFWPSTIKLNCKI